MLAAQLESPVTEAIGSLEVRWIVSGTLNPAVAEWFARFPAHVKSYEDDICSTRSCQGYQ